MNLVLQAVDLDGDLMTWKYPDIKAYLVHENHLHSKNQYRFHYAKIDDKELAYSDEWPDLMRDVGDFKTWCRRNLDREDIETDLPREIIRRFLLEENEDKKKRIYKTIIENENIDDFYNNGGGGLCEYRTGHISGYKFFEKSVEIEWCDENTNTCMGKVTRNQIKSEIKALIEEGVYLPNLKPKTLIESELEGQITIFDYM